jgi:hypothetical protein
VLVGRGGSQLTAQLVCGYYMPPLGRIRDLEMEENIERVKINQSEKKTELCNLTSAMWQ